MEQKPFYGIDFFDGKGNMTFDQWIEKFEDYLEQGDNYSSITDAQKIAKLKYFLQGLPREKLRHIPSDKNGIYEEVVKFLRKSLRMPAIETAKEILTTCYQKDEESVDDFVTRLALIVRTAYSDENEEAIINHLMDEFTSRVKVEYGILGRKFNNFEEAHQMARNMEKNYRSRTKNIPTGSINVLNLQQNLEALPNKNKANDKSFRSKIKFIRCWKCKKPGHVEKRCRKK